jgi:hypothetical protein
VNSEHRYFLITDDHKACHDVGPTVIKPNNGKLQETKKRRGPERMRRSNREVHQVTTWLASGAVTGVIQLLVLKKASVCFIVSSGVVG